MSQIEKFYTYLDELDRSYTRLAGLLREKLAAVTAGDLAKMDSLMKEEQVYALLARGFDQNLATHREKLGIRGETLADIINELPDSDKARFLALHKRLAAVLEEVRALNGKCQSAIEDRLYSLDRRIKELDKSANASYGKSAGAPPAGKSGMFTKSV